MPKTSEGTIAIVALIAFAAWLFIALPLLYLPSEGHAHGEILGVKYGEWLLFLATALLAWATFLLVKGAQLTAETQLRAYVNLVLDDKSVASLVGGSQQQCPIILKNFGNTPANDVVLNGNIAPVDWPLSAALPKLTTGVSEATAIGSRNVLHPQQQIPGSVFGEAVISAEEVSALQKSENRRLCMYGEITYRDVFNKTHSTKFRLVSRKIRELPARYMWCYEGNEFD
jgi:hypothetical protein